MPRGRPDFSIYAYTDIYAQTIDKLKVDIVAQTISELVARISAGLVTIDRGVIVDMGRAIGGTLVITYYPIPVSYTHLTLPTN